MRRLADIVFACMPTEIHDGEKSPIYFLFGFGFKVKPPTAWELRIIQNATAIYDIPKILIRFVPYGWKKDVLRHLLKITAVASMFWRNFNEQANLDHQ